MNKKEEKFIETIKEYYKRHGRRSLPWRITRDPYHILVSEIMLQQTQVERVIPKYEQFLEQFPTVEKLAEASLGDVLRLWQGLGYNRRAKMLHACAKIVAKDFRGQTPKTREELISLPGIGRYTAGAVMAFAYNKAIPIIETNIRSVYLHHFCKKQTDITDKELLPYIERTLDTKNPRTWYYALMDYGVYIKRTYGNPNERSKHHTKQSTFKGSDREIRGAIIRLLTEKSYTRNKLVSLLPFEDIRIDAQLAKLGEEGLMVQKGAYFTLPE